jgi:hypothetical protein
MRERWNRDLEDIEARYAKLKEKRIPERENRKYKDPDSSTM